MAADEARRAECGRARCGAIIVSREGEVIGRGSNGPPGGVYSQQRCERKQELSMTFKSDRTCCVHAEWRAILEAVRTHPMKVAGATLYFTRVNEVGEMEYSGEPYCTICSKLALEVGLGFLPCGMKRVFVFTTPLITTIVLFLLEAAGLFALLLGCIPRFFHRIE